MLKTEALDECLDRNLVVGLDDGVYGDLVRRSVSEARMEMKRIAEDAERNETERAALGRRVNAMTGALVLAKDIISTLAREDARAAAALGKIELALWEG